MRVDYNKRTVKQRLTTDKREIKNFLKLPLATSFIRSRYMKYQWLDRLSDILHIKSILMLERGKFLK